MESDEARAERYLEAIKRWNAIWYASPNDPRSREEREEEIIQACIGLREIAREGR